MTDHHDPSESYKLSVEIINGILNLIFLLEAVAKIIGLGASQYFKSG